MLTRLIAKVPFPARAQVCVFLRCFESFRLVNELAGELGTRVRPRVHEVARKAAESKIVRAIGIEVVHTDGHVDSRAEEQGAVFGGFHANGVASSLDGRQRLPISGVVGHILRFFVCRFFASTYVQKNTQTNKQRCECSIHAITPLPRTLRSTIRFWETFGSFITEAKQARYTGITAIKTTSPRRTLFYCKTPKQRNGRAQRHTRYVFPAGELCTA
jgi:hypothetical protein